MNKLTVVRGRFVLQLRKSPALSIVREGEASQVLDEIGGKGGNRTLDPGGMRPFLAASSVLVQQLSPVSPVAFGTTRHN
jgi:hypothetical protein